MFTFKDYFKASFELWPLEFLKNISKPDLSYRNVDFLKLPLTFGKENFYRIFKSLSQFLGTWIFRGYFKDFSEL